MMANTPNSIEYQIDNFLEHIKRSTSKAMDADWITTETLTNCQTTLAGTTTPTPTPLSSASTSSSLSSSTQFAVASFNHKASSPIKTTRTRNSCFDISQLGLSSGKH